MMNIAGGFIFTFFLSIVRISGDCSQGFPRLNSPSYTTQTTRLIPAVTLPQVRICLSKLLCCEQDHHNYAKEQAVPVVASEKLV